MRQCLNVRVISLFCFFFVSIKANFCVFQSGLCFFAQIRLLDISAARHADLLLVKQKEDGENDLAAYCVKENIKHVLFEDFSRALPVIQAIVKGEKTIAHVIAGEDIKELAKGAHQELAKEVIKN